jgi:hypothetical protein
MDCHTDIFTFEFQRCGYQPCEAAVEGYWHITDNDRRKKAEMNRCFGEKILSAEENGGRQSGEIRGIINISVETCLSAEQREEVSTHAGG